MKSWRVTFENLGQAEALLRGLMKTIPATAPKHAKEFMEAGLVEFKARILASKFDVHPLNEDYRRRKIAAGFSGRTLVRSQGYVDGLKLWTNSKGAVGIVPSGKSEDGTGLEYTKVAALLEYGTRKMLARPHWAPFGRWAQKKLWPKFATQWAKDAYARAMKMAKGEK